jgi:hypothetical protein
MFSVRNLANSGKNLGGNTAAAVLSCSFRKIREEKA